MGARTKLKAGAAGDKEGKPHLRVPPTPAEPMPRGGKPPAPPAGYHSGKVSRQLPPAPPAAGDADGRASLCRAGSARGRREPPAYPPIPPFFAPPLDKTQAYVYNVG